MRVYRAAWWTVWIAVAAPAFAVTYLAWPPTGVAVFAVAYVGVSISWFLILISAFSERSVRRCARTAAKGGLGAVAAAALVDVMGPAGLALVMLAAATSPPVLQTARRRSMRTRARRGGRQSRLVLDAVREERAWDGLLPGLLAQMTDADLCWAWRTSYLALGEHHDPHWRAQVVRVRQAYLTELERRHPLEVEEWLATCPRATTGPERFLRSGAHREDPPR